MSYNSLSDQAESYLRVLCIEIENRRLGSPGNRQGTDFFESLAASFGFQVERQEFACLDWEHEEARLEAGAQQFTVYPSPYSLGCQVQAPLRVFSSLPELEAADLSEAVALLHGELAKEQLMPRNFPFYNPEHHQHLLGLLEHKAPLAIIAATSRDPALAGGVYPFPLIEDGDFNLPSVYMTDREGERLVRHTGETIRLASRARRIPSTGCNVIANKAGNSQRRVVLSAHIDAKQDSPGALDNAAGVVVLLLLAELLQDFQGEVGLELVALNGEDHYSAQGEIQYVQHNRDRLDQVRLNINLDGVGFHTGGTAYSFYECPQALTNRVRRCFARHPGLLEGEQWYSGDHMIFVQNGVPALALTSEQGMTGLAEVSHTPRDRPELVDPAKLVAVALALQELVQELAAQ